MKVGYARVSSIGQNLDSQIEALEKIGCDKIYKEKRSGKQYDNRPILKEALEFCRDGDTFLVTRLDRCSRSVSDLSNIVTELKAKGVSFSATEQQLDTSSATGQLMINILATIAEFETNLRAERQSDGIASAKAKGKTWGRKSVGLSEGDIKEAVELQATLTNQEIADRFKVGRSTLLRYIKNFKENKGIVK
jgi:DNA invertase Pin-like site-specific DNA recombinase